MKINFKNIFVLTVSFLISLNAKAFIINNGVWHLSEIVTNNILYSSLLEVEDEARQGHLEKASSLINKIRNNEIASNYFTLEGEPLLLTLDSANLWYRCEAMQNKNDTILKEIRSKLDEWSSVAKNKRWKSYKYLFHRLRAYYVANRFNKERIDIQKEMIYYDPNDYSQIDSLIDYFYKFPECIGDLNVFMKKFKEIGGIVTPRLELFIVSHSDSSNSEKLNSIISWLYDNRNASLEMLQEGVNAAMQLVTCKDESTINDMFDILTDLAIWQPGNDERIPVIAFLLNERTKLKTISENRK